MEERIKVWKNVLSRELHLLLVNLVALGLYWIGEALIFEWLYAIIPVACVIGVAIIISFIVGMVTKKAWVSVAFPTSILVAFAALAVATRLFKGLPL